jgi:hypothetical protein
MWCASSYQRYVPVLATRRVVERWLVMHLYKKFNGAHHDKVKFECSWNALVLNRDLHIHSAYVRIDAGSCRRMIRILPFQIELCWLLKQLHTQLNWLSL